MQFIQIWLFPAKAATMRGRQCGFRSAAISSVAAFLPYSSGISDVGDGVKIRDRLLASVSVANTSKSKPEAAI